MGMAFLYYAVFLIFGFIGMYFMFAPQVKRAEKSGQVTFFTQPVLYMIFLFALGMIGAYFLSDNKDFISLLNPVRVILPILCVCMIYSADIFFGEKMRTIVLILCVGLCIFIQPVEKNFVPFGLNEYVFKTLAVAFFSVFCFFYYILNILPHTIVVATVSMLLGLSLLSVIGGAPVYLAIVAAMLIGCLGAYLWVNLHRVKIELDNTSCSILGFMIAYLFMLDMGELSFSSCIVFSTFFWAQLALALYNRFLVNKSGDLIENSHLFAVAQKITLAALMSNIFKVGMVCMFFGWFQLFSVNQYSLPLVTFFVVLWLNSTMGANILQTPKTLKQVNSEFVEDIKQNLKDTKETLSQISNKKD